MNQVPPSVLPLRIERPGPIGHWLRSFGLMVVWELKSMRLVLPLAIVVQILMGAGMIVGYGFLLGDVPVEVALYMATGVTVISMITIGLVLYPQLIAVQKDSGIYDYMFSLPVPRTTSIAAGLLVSCIIALPGMIIALLVAWWRWDLPFHLKPIVLPAVALILLTAASIGFALAHAIPKPQITGLVTQVLVFFIILFSPLAYPPERLPDWFAAVHRVLPFQHAANVMRASLTQGLATDVAQSFAVLVAWAAASWVVTAWVVGRRG